LRLQQIHNHNLIADSGQATVYRGTYKSSRPQTPEAQLEIVAIKVFKGISANEAFVTELTAMLQLWKDSNGQHPNIMRIRGCFDIPKPCIFMPYFPQGDLQKYIESRKGVPIDNALVSKLALGIASGLAFLHKKNFIHRDLKSLNILLTRDLTPVITDFGFTKFTVNDMTAVTMTIVCSAPWMSPEMIEGYTGMLYSNKIDIYAFGIILYEILACSRPYPDLTPYQILLFVLQGGRPTINSAWNTGLSNLMMSCWHQDPQQRPASDEVVKVLKTPPPKGQEKKPAKMKVQPVLNGHVNAAGHPMNAQGYCDKQFPQNPYFTGKCGPESGRCPFCDVYYREYGSPKVNK